MLKITKIMALLKNIPKKMIVIGAGVIGLEMGSIFSRIGSEVTVIEYLDHIAVGMDREVAKSFQKILKKQGINFLLNNSVTEIKVNKNIATVRYEGRDKSELKTISADIVFKNPKVKILSNLESGSNCNNPKSDIVFEIIAVSSLINCVIF